MGFRIAVRKLTKPAVMALVAGSLALSLTVTTTQKAEASPAVAVAPVIAAAEGILAGGVRLALPSLLTIAIATNPVGWAIGLGALGVGLYASKDYWLPWVQDPAGEWGKATGGNPSSPVETSESVRTFPQIEMLQAGADAQVVLVSGVWYGTRSSSYAVGWSASLACKNTVTGVTTIRGWSSQVALAANANTNTSVGVSVYCRVSPSSGNTITNEIVVGGSLGPHGARPEFPASCYPFGAANAVCYQPGPGNVLNWGTLLPTATPAFDPKGADVKYKSTTECVDAAGNKTTIVAESFGDEGGIKFGSCEAAGKGHGTGNTSVVGIAPGTTTEKPLWGSLPMADPTMPLCSPERPSPCKMAITIDGKPCTVGAWDCENWTDIYNDSVTKPRVGCTYGPYTLEVDQCKVMEPAYRPGGAPATEENMDGDPATRNNLQPGGTTYAPPATGTGVIPGAAGQPGPGATPEEAGCFPSGWAMLNPVEWVMKPVGCALTAAFVPKAEVVQAQQTRIQTKIQNVGFARLSDAWLSTFEAVGGSSGCAGPTVNFDMQGVHQTLQPFNACSAPMSTVAGVSYAVSSISIVLFGGLGMIRAVASAFGFNFTLGKGSSE